MCLPYFVIYTLKTDSTQSKLLLERKALTQVTQIEAGQLTQPNDERESRPVNISIQEPEINAPAFIGQQLSILSHVIFVTLEQAPF